MFAKRKEGSNSARERQPKRSVSESFRRNNVVISKSQREIAARQQSVTQRQQDSKKRQIRHARRIRALVLVVIVLVAIVGYRMRINSVSLSSNASAKLPTETQALYEKNILESYANHTIAGQSWLLDHAALEQDVKSKFSEVEWVEFSSAAPFSSALKANMRFRKPVFTWKDASGQQQFVDKNGVLFAKNLDPSVDVKKLIAIEDQSGVVLDAGSSVLTETLVQFVGQLHAKLPPLYGNRAVVSRVIVPRSTREVQAQIKGQNYLIKFNSNRNIDEQLGELKTLLAYLKASNSTPGAYIDVRTAHKAFYK